MILLIDNYDSFVHTLAGYVRELGRDTLVIRNDAVTLDEVERLGASHIIISPGPGAPSGAGISTALVRRFGPAIPILGVCLGHQCIGEAWGGKVVRARPRHGKASAVHHDGRGLFAGLESPFQAARYHSLVVERSSLPADLRITAESDDGTIMAMEHRTHPVVGVQFHPESVLSDHGHLLIERFLHL
jgi:anthranilate synthase/aminodeoxychorismate synthase-like glutamine amidotransferase